MYFTSLPDHSEPGFDEQLHFSKFRKHNIIFNAQSERSYCEHHIGCLSVKTIWKGEEWYGIDNHQLAVRPGQFLILNDDQDYSSRVDKPGGAGILSVFFKKEFASSIFRDALYSEEALLDNPFEPGGKTLEFFQTLYDMDPRLQQKLLGLIQALNKYGYEVNRVDEHLFFLLHDLIRFHKREAHRAGQVSAIKPGTRMEIYKRICIAKDLLHSNYMNKPDLSGISMAACLSVPQLIRQFKAVFQITPHQYLTRIRLANAARLLKETSASVHEITWMCGFENASAFSRAFKSEHGVQPVHFRKMS
ncbi:MAG: AraC family transcriptional regulator [Bacteroidota bacterium]|nr:AraC family transcriptional regulator [Bacteroidota bacterium]